jgi:hypothetical protein
LFFDALCDTTIIEFFNKKAIRKLIEYKWPLVFEYTIKRLLIPFAAFMIVYNIYSYMIYYIEDNVSYKPYLEYPTLLMLIGLGGYLFYLELG